MLMLDITIVQVALPTIQRHLSANFSDLQSLKGQRLSPF